MSACPVHARAALAATSLLFGLAIASSADASERHMTYTYSSNVLPAGGIEIEPWSTFRLGRHGFYMGMDHRLEFEVGVTDAIQTAFYLNMSNVTENVKTPEGTERHSDFEWSGISWEWKFKLLDSVADPVGLALYIEPGIGPTEGELEAKVIVDKRVGNFYFAWNPVFEYEFEFGEASEVEHELIIENDVGLIGFLTEHVTLGVELRNQTVLVEGGKELESSVFWAGPTVSFNQEAWWTALSLLPQLGAVKSDETSEQLGADGTPNDGPFELVHAERLQARVLIGLTI
jgi:hypothetical protein